MYNYESPIGTFIIRRLNDGRFGLYFQDELLGSYHSAIAAADDVYMHATGYHEFDELDGTLDDVPTDIYEWERI